MDAGVRAILTPGYLGAIMTFSFRILRMSIHKQVLKFVTSLYLKVDFTLVTPRIQLDIISSPLKFMLKVLILFVCWTAS